jgi:uncharacterized protein DUF1629
MKYFLLDTLGDVDGERAVIDRAPEDLGLQYYRLAKGVRIGDLYPDDARVLMSKKFQGLKLDSLLGNTKGFLIVKVPVKEAIEAHCADDDIEYLPFTLYNLKKRVQSKDYFIVNPIGTVDCLNLEASVIKYVDKPGDPSHGAVVNVKKYVFEPKKLKRAPALFRVKEKPTRYVVNEQLASAFDKAKFSNISLTEVEQAEGKAR